MKKGTLTNWQWTAWSLSRRYLTIVQQRELRKAIAQAEMQRRGHTVTPAFSPVMIIPGTRTPQAEPEAKKH